jgi:hypothetical protein
MRGWREVPDEAKRPGVEGPGEPRFGQDLPPHSRSRSAWTGGRGMHLPGISETFASLFAHHPLESAARRPGEVCKSEAGEGVWHDGHRSD